MPPENVYQPESVADATRLASGFINAKTLKRLASYGREFIYTQPVFSALADNNADTMGFLVKQADASPVARGFAIEALKLTLSEGASQILRDMAVRYDANDTTLIIDALKYRGTDSAAEALALIGQTKTRTHGASALSALLELQRETPSFANHTVDLVKILAHPNNIEQYIGSMLDTDQNPSHTPLKICFDEAASIGLLGKNSPKLLELFNGAVKATTLAKELEIVQNSQHTIHATLFDLE